MSPSQGTSQGELNDLLERCAVELWATDNRVRGMGEDNWDALGWADRRDYRLMAAAVLKEAGLDEVPTVESIHVAARPNVPECESSSYNPRSPFGV